MTVILIVSLMLNVVLGYFVYSLSVEVRQLRAHLTELRNGIDKANAERYVARQERDNARRHIQETREEIEKAIATAEQNKVKIEILLTELQDYLLKEKKVIL